MNNSRLTPTPAFYSGSPFVRRPVALRLCAVPGRIVGSIVCCVVFAVAGALTGLVFPWIADDHAE